MGRNDEHSWGFGALRECGGLLHDDAAVRFPGVSKSYAIQAGREIRVFVMPDQIDDLEAAKLAQSIARKIEEDLKYPGEIKVNVIREMRVTEYAR